MNRLEKLRNFMNLPVEDIAERLAGVNYGHSRETDSDIIELSMMYGRYDVDPAAIYCIDNHKDCEYLDSYYDCECPEYYGSCSKKDRECPYKVNRFQILRDSIIEDLSKEVVE